MVKTSLNTSLFTTPKNRTSPQNQTTSSQPSPMDISPNNPQNPSMEADTPPLQPVMFEDPKQTQGTESVAEELDDQGSKSKKRKAEEPVEEWVELGEPILKNKPMELRRIETKCEKLIQGMCINLDWCKSVNFDELLDVFEAQGWIKLVSTCFDNPLSYRLMNDFTSNFVNVDGKCSSKVVGIKIEFDGDTLAEAFGVPNEGFDSYFKGFSDFDINGVKIDEIVKSIGGNPKITKTNHKNFTPLQKLLFIFVWRDIIPRSQHRHEANHLDAVLMYCLENKIQINFPSIMIQHLTHCITHNMMIGYGNLLMYLFECFGINLSKYELLKLQTNHFIQPKTLDSLSMEVVDGKVVFAVKKLKGVEKKSEVKEELEETEKKESEPVRTEEKSVKKQRGGKKEVEEVKEQESKEVKKKETGKKTAGTKSLVGRLGKFDGGTKRKSIRLALKPKVRKSSPTPVNLDESDDNKGDGSRTKATTEAKVLFGPEKLGGKGFAGFSSSSANIEELKSKVDKMERTQKEVLGRLDDIEEVLSKLVGTTDDLQFYLKKSVGILSEGQQSIKHLLDEMVLTVVPAENPVEPDDDQTKDEEQSDDDDDDDPDA